MENNTNNSEMELKQEVKEQNNNIKGVNKEIKKKVKDNTPEVEACYISVSKKINKRYKMKCLSAQKVNNIYIQMLLDEIYGLLLDSDMDNKRINTIQYKELINQLNYCLKNRKNIVGAYRVGEKNALKMLAKSFSKELERLDKKITAIYAEIDDLDAKLERNPDSTSLKNDYDYKINELDAVQGMQAKIIDIAENYSLEAISKGIDDEKTKTRGIDTTGNTAAKISIEAYKDETKRKLKEREQSNEERNKRRLAIRNRNRNVDSTKNSELEISKTKDEKKISEETTNNYKNLL